MKSLKEKGIFKVIAAIITVILFLSLAGSSFNRSFMRSNTETKDEVQKALANDLVDPTRADNMDMIFFLHNVTDVEPAKSLPGGDSTWNWFDTEPDFNGQNSTIHIEGTQTKMVWYLSPTLAAPINSSSLSLKIWIRGQGTNPGGNPTVTVSEKTAGGENEIWTNTFGNTPLRHDH